MSRPIEKKQKETTTAFDPGPLLRHLTHRPGTYEMIDKKDNVIYVGKARDLRRRVGSYFSGPAKDAKTMALIKLVADIQVTVTQTETEALILENKHFRNRLVLQINKTLISILNPDFLHINIKQVTSSFVDWAHKKSIIINTYTINDKRALEQCISLGVDGVFTDNHQLYNK